MVPHTQIVTIVLALWIPRGTPTPAGNPLQPRPFRIEGPTPLPPEATGPTIAPTTLRPHARAQWPFAQRPSVLSPSSLRGSPPSAPSAFRPLAPSAPAKHLMPPPPSPSPANSNRQAAPANSATPTAPNRLPLPAKQGNPSPQNKRAPKKSRDQQSAATEARAASLRSPLAVRLLQEAYVHSAAQEAMASDPVIDAEHRQHRLLALPQHHHRHVVIPSPEAARLLANAVNHNLLADVTNPLQGNPIVVQDVTPGSHEQHLQLTSDEHVQPAQVELQPDYENLQNQQNVQNVHLQHVQNLQFQGDVQDLHLQPESQRLEQSEEQHHGQASEADVSHNQQEVPENQEQGIEHDARYDYMYRVRDYDGNDFGHTEMRSGERTWGHYYVQLPDGRLKTVRYWADDSGYHAEVEYEGNAEHPKEEAEQ